MLQFLPAPIILMISLNIFFQPLTNGAHGGHSPKQQHQDNCIVTRTKMKHPPVKDDLIVFPNPVQGDIVRFSEVIRGDVFNMLGQKVRTVNNRNYLDVNNINKGMYVLRTQKGAVRKFIIERQ